jgi:hypothetical protein
MPPTLVSSVLGGTALHCDRLPQPQRIHTRAATQDALQPDGQHRLRRALLRARRGVAGSLAVSNVGQEGKHEVELLLTAGRCQCAASRATWCCGEATRRRTTSGSEWLRLEELAHCQEKVAEYNSVALRRRGASRRVGPYLPAGRQPR